jgi:hypothetical protein
VAARGEDDLVPAAGVLFRVFGGAVIPLSLEISPPQGSCPPIVKSAQRRTPGDRPARQSCNSGHRPDQCTTCWSTAQRTYMRNPSSRPRPGMPAVARYKLIWRSAANTSPATWYIAVSRTAGPVQLQPSSAPRCPDHHGRPRPLPTALAGQCAVTPGRRPVSSAGLDGVEFAVIAR